MTYASAAWTRYRSTSRRSDDNCGRPPIPSTGSSVTAYEADRWFQIERLSRFNAKFSPEWRPRYLIYQQHLALPRCALAVLWAEGQLPKPTLRIAKGAVAEGIDQA